MTATTTTTVTTIPVGILKAALTHAHKDDVSRRYLEGIYIDLSSGHIVSTDGHRMLVARLPADCRHPGASYIVPRDVIERALKGAGKLKALPFTWSQDTRPDPERPGVTIVSQASVKVLDVTCTPIDYRYPEWRRVVPQDFKSDGSAPAVNPQYMLDAFKALAMILFNGSARNFHHAGRWPAAHSRRQ